MPYAVGLDTIGTNNPIIIEDTPVPGDYIEIPWDDYLDAIDCLVSGLHVCVVNGSLILDYQIPQTPSEE